MGFGLHIGILNLEIQIGHWATYWNYKFRNKDDWDYSYRLRFWLQIGITDTDWDFAYRLGLQIQIEIWATDWD